MVAPCWNGEVYGSQNGAAEDLGLLHYAVNAWQYDPSKRR